MTIDEAIVKERRRIKRLRTTTRASYEARYVAVAGYDILRVEPIQPFDGRRDKKWQRKRLVTQMHWLCDMKRQKEAA